MCASSKKSSYLAQVKGVEGEVSGLAVLLVHVDDGGEQEDLCQRDPEEELPHGTLLYLWHPSEHERARPTS